MQEGRFVWQARNQRVAHAQKPAPHADLDERPRFPAQVSMFYICACSAMALSLYNLVLTSFSMVQGQGLALRGPPGSIAKAVRIFQDQWRVARFVLLTSLLALVLAGVSISWMKLDKEIDCGAGVVACWLERFWKPLLISTMVASLMTAMLFKVREMQVQLRIPTEYLVRGDLLVQNEADARLDMMAEDEERIEAR